MCLISFTIQCSLVISKFYTVQSSLFFRKMDRIERLPVWTAILETQIDDFTEKIGDCEQFTQIIVEWMLTIMQI